MSKRFDYIKYDKISVNSQEVIKKACEELERLIDDLSDGRAKFLALNKLEECYMWTGKSIRDEQITDECETEHVPERGE